MARPLRFRIYAWLAAAAMLFASVAPAVAHTARSSTDRADVLGEICTSFGLKRVVLGADRSSSSQPGDQHSADCPFCLLHAALGPPPTLIRIPGATHLVEPVMVPASAPQPRFDWAAHRPRGPPEAS